MIKEMPLLARDITLAEITTLAPFIQSDFPNMRTNISQITSDTRDVRRDCIFFLIRGRNYDPTVFINENIEKASKFIAIVTENPSYNEIVNNKVPPLADLPNVIVVPNIRYIFAEVWNEYYEYPVDHLNVTAVTGTNGKSSVVYFIRQMMEQLGERCGTIGTFGYYTGIRNYDARFTTPEPEQLFSLFEEIRVNKVKNVAIEASSQALDQERLGNLKIDVGVFTNLTRDHIDWHNSFENYYNAKKSLFSMVKRAIINYDDEKGRRLGKEVAEEFGIMPEYFSISKNINAKVYAEDIVHEGLITKFNAVTSYGRKLPVRINSIGDYNVSNVLAAITIFEDKFREEYERELDEHKKITPEFAEKLETPFVFNAPPGRCEIIFQNKFTVIRDYAHTEDGLEKFLSSVNDIVSSRGKVRRNRIITVFGAAGERDEIKRPAMGKVAAEYSDLMIITSDNPRFESAQEIMEHIEVGIPRNSIPYEKIEDRQKAIIRALNIAKEGDIILLCGKGHENYQAIMGVDIPFDEKKIVYDYMAPYM